MSQRELLQDIVGFFRFFLNFGRALTTFSARIGSAEPMRGFTLIEILVVVVIIGLLAGLVAINLIPRAEEAKRTAAFTQMRSFEQALELFKLDNGRYPSTQEGLEILVAPPGGKEPYLKGGKIPLDPWGHPYVYTGPGGSTAQGRPYDILSYGADGQPGGTGDNADISLWDIQGKEPAKP